MRSRRTTFTEALASLTGLQLEAVSSPARALCIVAGAGSGKTRVLTLRVARRIRDGSADADHTAVCTFTRKAAHELRGRLRLYGVPVSTPAASGGVPGPGVRAGTLHQLGLTLLRRHALDTGRPPPLVAEHRWRTIVAIVGDPAAASAVDTEIGWAKARCLRPGTYAEAALLSERVVSVAPDRVDEAFADYEAALARRHALDLDDVLVRAADLFHDDAGFAERMHWRYRHLSVDEFQDVNPAQFRLIRALLGNRDDLCAVGDPNQAIYGWNGADPTLLARLPRGGRGDGGGTPRREPPVDTPGGGGGHRRPGPHPLGPAPLGGRRRPDAGGDGLRRRRCRGRGRGGLAARPLGGRGGVVGPGGAGPDPRPAGHHGPGPGPGRNPPPHGSGAGIPARGADVHRSGAGARGGPVVRRAPGGRPGQPLPSHGEGDDVVELATFHRAKGLEWASVHVVGLEEGFVPIVYAESSEARDEERRLLYVALTRASRDLHCSWVRSRRMANGRRMDRQPSPWLAAVARVSRTGTGRTPRRDTNRMIAEMRAGLGR